MTDLDDDRIELLERQLAERVADRVRPALFRVYAAVGGAVLAVLGFIGYDIVSSARTQVTRDIRQELSDDLRDIDQQVARLHFSADQAELLMDELNRKLKAFEPNAKRLDEAIAKIDDLKTAAQDSTDIYESEIKPMMTTVDALSSELTNLAKQVKSLGRSVPQEDPGYEQAVQQVIESTEQVQKRAAEARAQTTVFFQFAGGRREQAQTLATRLESRGYLVPGEEREGSAAHKSEVRFFHERDQESAEKLAADATGALRDLGYSVAQVPDVTVNSLVDYPAKKPRPGVVELWVELPFRKRD